jgi:ATPase subunit of ABC transporter with duplicated ATPase domains
VIMDHEKWLAVSRERNVLSQGKFTFSELTPLKKPTEVAKVSDITLISIKDVRFSYEPKTLPFIFDTPISYEIKVGTRVGIIGPNGAGKLTLLKLIAGKIEATDGSITHHLKYVPGMYVL